jgi:hypothetical protein
MVARFQFARGLAAQSTLSNRWPGEWASAMPSGLGWSFDRSTGGSVDASAWRLVGANNRELGRSAATYPDLESCRDAVMYLREHIDEAETLLANASDSGLWLWRLNIRDRWIAASGRSYLRRRECLYNLAQFSAEVPIAVLATDVLGRLEPRSGRRSELRLIDLDTESINLDTGSINVSTGSINLSLPANQAPAT